MTVYESKKNKKARRFQIIGGTIFIILCIICLLPIIHVISVSFSSKEAILLGQVGLLPVNFTTEAYKMVFENTGFLQSFAFSIVLTLASTLLSMIVTILAAYPLARKGLKGGSLIMLLLVITMYFDPGMIPNYLNVKNLHLLDSVWALIIPCLLNVYNLIILRTFFGSIDSSLHEAAKIDGAGELRTLLNIIIPLAKPAIATLSLFYAVSRWNGVTDVIQYINDTELFTVQVKLKQMLDTINVPAQELQDVQVELVAENIKSAAIVFSMVPMGIAYPFIQKYFVSGIMVGSVKG